MFFNNYNKSTFSFSYSTIPCSLYSQNSFGDP